MDGTSGPVWLTGLVFAGARSVRRSRVFSSPMVASRSATVSTHGPRDELFATAPASLNAATSVLWARSGRSCASCPQPIPGVGRASAGTGTPSVTPWSAAGSMPLRVAAGVHARVSRAAASRFISSGRLGNAKPPGRGDSPGAKAGNASSDVEVERELHRAGPQADGIELLLDLGVDP